jgi:hypothetical protein
MKSFLFYFYIGLIFLALFLIVYRIYKYGVTGYIEKRRERRRQRFDRLNNIFRNTY